MSGQSYRIEIAYEGTRFHGWARQGDSELRTVQAEIEAALRKLFGLRVPLTAAGRTDAGVHALRQVASFALGPDSDPPVTFLRALNALTPPDIAILELREAEPGFDARRAALSRRYRYRLDTNSIPNPFERRYAKHHPYALDRALLEAATAQIVGRHDFTAFTPTDTAHVHFHRHVLEAQWRDRPQGMLELEIEAETFMRSMVRVIVGTLLEIAAGERPPEDLGRLLGGRPREEAGDTAPAHGLFLISVSY